MRIGVFNNGWWRRACQALNQDAVDLPVAAAHSGNAYDAQLSDRLANGTAIAASLAENPVDLLLDNGGAGLGFLPGNNGSTDCQLVHEASGKVLVSHFIDPLQTAFGGLGWPTTWQCLQSNQWVKAVWDRGHVLELQRFGVPNVIHLPMAAPNRKYDTQPLDPAKCRPIVSFVGAQNSTYFSANSNIPSTSLFAGTLAQAVRTDNPDVGFYEMYHDAFGLGTPISQSDDVQTRLQKTSAYFGAKLFYHASLGVRNRDRFVIYLTRKLGDSFHLAGRRWDTVYQLPTSPPFETDDEYFDHFRTTAININLVNGNAETGLNMRHFEITAAGGFMLCYNQPELGQHFEIGKECAVFYNESDLIEKVQYYLSHADERVAIARAGQMRTLSSHLYSHRLQSVLDQFKSPKLPVTYSNSTWQEDFKKLVPAPDVILDCGANVGQMVEGFRSVYALAEIYSFEPVASLFAKLKTKCERLGAHAVKKATADFNGTTRINLTESPEANSLLGFQEGNPCAKWTREIGSEEIEVCTLDQWCEECGIDHNRVDIIKLDVQGSELKALRGAAKLLQTVKIVYLEVAFVPIYKDGPLFDEIETFMAERGYKRFSIYPSDQPQNWGDALYVKK